MNHKDVAKVAIVGSGAIATRAHLPCFARNRNARIEAIVDVDLKKAKKVAEKFGVKQFFPSVDELLDSVEVDAMSICTPPNLHAQMATKAFECGVNVLCEKPLADKFEDGLRIVKAAEKSGKLLMTGFNRRFWPNYLRIKDVIEEGQMGAVYMVEYHSLQRSPLMGWSKSPWYYHPGIGGSLHDQGPHVFDILNWLLGVPHSVYAYSGKHSNSLVDEFCVVLIRYNENKIGIGIMSWLASVRIEQLFVNGTAKSIYVSPDFLLDVNPTDFNETSLLRAAFSKLTGKIFTERLDPYQLEINHFIDCVRTGRKPSPDGWDGLKTLAVADAAVESLRTRKEVDVSNFKIQCSLQE